MILTKSPEKRLYFSNTNNLVDQTDLHTVESTQRRKCVIWATEHLAIFMTSVDIITTCLKDGGICKLYSTVLQTYPLGSLNSYNCASRE